MLLTVGLFLLFPRPTNCQENKGSPGEDAAVDAVLDREKKFLIRTGEPLQPIRKYYADRCWTVLRLGRLEKRPRILNYKGMRLVIPPVEKDEESMERSSRSDER